jgi:DNA polymerase III epsilon subunit-like protein
MTLFLDTETTGLGRGDRLVEIGVVDDTGAVAFQSLINPGMPIPPEVSEIHGITDAMVRDAPLLDDIAASLRTMLIADGSVVIYNADFDCRFFPRKFWTSIDVACAMLRYRNELGRWDRLGNAAKRAGHVWEGDAHRAVADALACRSVWNWLERRASPARPPPTTARPRR